MLLLGISFIVPNLNVMLSIGGSILGTIVSVVIPVLFYNKAYSQDEVLNLDKDKSGETK
jgi:hypothetical protein